MAESNRKKKVLIVEDDRDVLRALIVWLSAANYETIEAQDGATAVTAARRERPDVIVLDIGLPAGDGFVVMERLQSMGDLATVPIVVVSARDPAKVLPRLYKSRVCRAGARAFLEKPFDSIRLTETIAQVLG